MIFSLALVVRYGKSLRVQKNACGEYDQSTLKAHQRWVKVLFWVTLTAIAVIEPTFRILKTPYPLFFFCVHMPFFVCYGISYGMAWKYSGLFRDPLSKYPERHSEIGRETYFFGVVTALTGDWLVYTLLWLPYQGI